MAIIDGKEIALEVKNNLKKEIANLGITPGLAIILVGNNDASEIYVKNKLKASAEVGIKAEIYRFNEENTEEEIANCIKDLNINPEIDGIILQSPVPSKFNETYLCNLIDSKKDVDGFGLYSLGALASNEPTFIAATPLGILKLLESTNVSLEGKHAVIVGRSKIVGRPLSLALLNKDATVTITHSKTKNLKEIAKQADILIVAIGKAKFITEDYIKEGAIVIDVGMNRLDGKLCGDVDFDNVKAHTSFITPVPGGVGPMTVAMLLNNVLISAKKRKERK